MTTKPDRPADTVFAFSDRITAFPVVHGSGDVSQEVRRVLLSRRFDCLAVPLPASFRREVERAVAELPQIQIVAQYAPDHGSASYVPIDPCQPIIAGIRIALQERMERAFIDLETPEYEPYHEPSPDPYALKRVSPERFAASLLPFVRGPEKGSQREARIRRMAFELHRLELEHESILFLPAIQDWPFLRDAYRERASYPEHGRTIERAQAYKVTPETLYFVLGELPFVTQLYEGRRRELRSDTQISIDGVKELLLEARTRWKQTRIVGKNWITPQLLRVFLQYARNLTLMDGRLTPDLYTLATAAKQVAGDAFAIKLVEVAREYDFQSKPPILHSARIGVESGALGDDPEVTLTSRLPGPPIEWRPLHLRPEPAREQSERWAQRWNPYEQCSWPPEDEQIESFHTHVRDQAQAMLAEDLGRSEKFTSSLKDGLDMRETLRNWHSGDLYVREVPPSRGSVEVVVFLFEDPIDEDAYSWRSTWFAEHEEESTLCFFATPFPEQIIGPGVALARYGGLFLLYPPRWIPDIWDDPRLDGVPGAADRLVAGALLHSQEKNVVLVSPRPPRSQLRLLARRFRKRIVHLPLHKFSGQTIEKIRHFHVLNGQDIRSYASKYIRDF